MWSQAKCESVSRTVSALTLDGKRLIAEFAVALRRPLAQLDADAVGNELAGIVESVLSEQIVQDGVPFGPRELEQMVLARAKASAGKIAEVRVARLSLAVQGPKPTKTSAPPAAAGSAVSGRMSAAPRSVHTSLPPPRSTSHPTPASDRAPASGIEGIAPGASVGRVVRDTAASAVATVLSTVSTTIDRTRPGEGEVDREVRACLVALAYRALLEDGATHRTAASTVESACRHAGWSEEPPATDIGRYISSHAPASELAIHVAALLGSPQEESKLREALAPHCESIRAGIRALPFAKRA